MDFEAGDKLFTFATIRLTVVTLLPGKDKLYTAPHCQLLNHGRVLIFTRIVVDAGRWFPLYLPQAWFLLTDRSLRTNAVTQQPLNRSKFQLWELQRK